jgi:IS30 family transposase
MPEMVNTLTAEDWHMIKSMKEQGTSVSEIARRTSASRKTIRIYQELKEKGFPGSVSYLYTA